MNIGETITYLYRIKTIKANLNKRIKALEDTAAEHEENLIKMIQEQGVDSLRSHGISATISTESYGQVDDYEAFENYVINTKSLFLLQRRLSQAAYNDLKASGETIPGLKDYTKNKLSLRKA